LQTFWAFREKEKTGQKEKTEGENGTGWFNCRFTRTCLQ
jgi:hypothetical protein